MDRDYKLGVVASSGVDGAISLSMSSSDPFSPVVNVVSLITLACWVVCDYRDEYRELTYDNKADYLRLRFVQCQETRIVLFLFQYR